MAVHYPSHWAVSLPMFSQSFPIVFLNALCQQNKANTAAESEWCNLDLGEIGLLGLVSPFANCNLVFQDGNDIVSKL